MRILVTGSLGHIGSRLIREIPNYFPSLELVIIDNLSTKRYASLFNLPGNAVYRFVDGDILETDLTSLMAGVDAAVHLAAITDAAGSFQDREKVEYVNYNATQKVAESCVLLGIPMIHLSSTSVYGTQESTVDEDCPEEDLKPQSPYAETKLREERLLQEMAITKDLHFVTCRFGTIVGISPGMRFHTAVNKFCWQAVLGQPLTVWRTALHQKRPYLSLDDAINALCFILDRRRFDNRVYNVVTENLTVNDVITWIRPHITNVRIKYVDAEIMNQLSYEASNQRFCNLGFVFTGSIEKNIAETIGLLRKAGGYSD
ncbi:MAG TPA: SDR family oxidoreductase [Syntrophales bacterium]|nr:SDR family oxidoreductase [Syntrophales bacterium]